MENPENLKPYDQYKDSGVEWLGEIPIGWEARKLKAFGDLSGGGTPNTETEKYWGGDITWVTPKDLTASNSEYLYSSERTLTFLGLPHTSKMLEKGTILFGCRAPVGNVAIAGIKLTTNQGFISISPNAESASRFLFYLLKSAVKIIQNESSGTTFQEISRGKLSGLKFPLPPLETQQRIVTFLDAETARIDNLVSELLSMIALLRENRKVLISDTVTRGIAGEHTEYKGSGVEWLGEIPSGWVKQKLKKVSSWTSGATPNTSNQEFYENGTVDWAIIADLNDGNVSSTRKKITEAASKLTGAITPINSVMIGMYASVGKLGMAKIPMATNQAILWTTKVNGIKEHYLFYYLMGIRQEMIKLGNSSTQNNINKTIVEQFPIPLPPLEIQQRIVTFLDAETAKIDTLIAETTSAITLLKEERKALISDIVTGKLEV